MTKKTKHKTKYIYIYIYIYIYKKMKNKNLWKPFKIWGVLFQDWCTERYKEVLNQLSFSMHLFRKYSAKPSVAELALEWQQTISNKSSTADALWSNSGLLDISNHLFSMHLKVFWYFQGIEKGYTGNKWVIINHMR